MSKAPHLATEGSELKLDKDWIRTSFMLPHVPNKPLVSIINDDDKKWLFYTSAHLKFTTTGLGGNFAINMPPKYTRYADIPTGLRVDHIANNDSIRKGAPARDRMMIQGMGRYYSESIDDNAELVFMRFGVPEYKGLITFFTGFYDVEASQLARDGRASLSFLAGKLIGTVIALPYTAIIFLYKAAKFFLSGVSTRYYNCRPAMALYWARVNMIAAYIATSKGLIPRGKLVEKFMKGTKSMAEELGFEDIPTTQAQYRNQFEGLRKIAPQWFGGKNSDGGLDVQRIIGTPQAIANRSREEIRKLAEQATSQKDIQKRYDEYFNKYGHDTRISASAIDDYLKRYQKSAYGNPEYAREDPYLDQMKDRAARIDEVAASDGNASLATGGGAVSEGAVAAVGGDGTTTTEGGAAPAPAGTAFGTTQFDELARAYASEDGGIYPVLLEDGTGEDGTIKYKRSPSHADDPSYREIISDASTGDNQWLIVRIEETGTVGESFSNQTSTSEIQSKLNSASSASQSARFSLSDFNTGFDAIDAVLKSIKSGISGLASGLQLDGLVALSGAGFVDIPERWENSTADFPSTSYNLQLRAPYGDPLSQFINIDVPLACLLAAALPISHGNQSYGSPFLCELYSKGRVVVRLGMISSLSITRGTGNMGWSPDGSPLGVDISFTVKDLSTVMHAPIDVQPNKAVELRSIFPRDTAFYDYLSVLGNMNVHQMTTDLDRFWLNVAQKRTMLKNLFSMSNFVHGVFDTSPGRLMQRVRAERGEGHYATMNQ